jgi:3-deoxy-D-manno-octulosonic-acid transferase
MAIIYYIFALILYLIALPILVILLFKKKYKNSIPARFFLFHNPTFKNKTLYFHSCSLGETKALKPLIEKFDKVNISVITETGFKEAKKYKNSDVRYLPFEIFIPFWLKNCSTLIVMEAELWLILFLIAKKRCGKTILINARISDKSYPKYLKFKLFYKYLFQYVDIIFAQTEVDKNRLYKLGAKNVIVGGNIKSAVEYKITHHYKKPKEKLIVAGSTHKGEEELILEAFQDLKNCKIVIAPRHPERFDEVYNIIKKFALKNHFSYGKIDNSLKNDIILVNKMGELLNLYSIADVVILGGSFVDNVGGHNPLEVAYFQKPLISGKYIFNQKALFEMVENSLIIENYELKGYLKKQLPNSKIKNKGDIQQILDEIKK